MLNKFRMYSTDTVPAGTALTGTGAIAVTLQRGDVYALAEVRLTLNSAAADLDEFVVSLDSERGAAWDHTIATPDPDEDLTVVTSFRYADPVPPIIFPLDKVVITWPNAGGKTWALDVIGLE